MERDRQRREKDLMEKQMNIDPRLASKASQYNKDDNSIGSPTPGMLNKNLGNSPGAIS